MTQALKLSQTLSLKMNANLQQAISMLQLSSLDLQKMLNNELADNPFLNNNDDSTSLEQTAIEVVKEHEVSENDSNQLSMQHIYASSSKYASLEQITDIEHNKTLKEHLTEQIYLEFEQFSDKQIAFLFLDYLDDNGYLTKSSSELIIENNINPIAANKVLEKLKRFEPNGVFAENLQDCLKIQLTESNIYNKNYQLILENLHLVAKRDYQALSKITKLNTNKINELVANIKKLQPKPGINFISEKVILKTPDVYVRKSATKKYQLELNQHNLPKILINKSFYRVVQAGVKNKDEKKYIKEKFNSAQNLLKAVEQRAETILNVATAIIEEQVDFFEYGIMKLKPLTLAEIAKKINMHESTISRVTTNKYMSTPRGIFEFKYFFSKAIDSKNNNSTISNTKVKEIIKQLIATETSATIYSDEALATELNKFNIKLARRTVAKYREELGIPSSSMRKRIMQC